MVLELVFVAAVLTSDAEGVQAVRASRSRVTKMLLGAAEWFCVAFFIAGIWIEVAADCKVDVPGVGVSFVL